MLKVKLAPGMYIVAVSGGVDSMVLLDVLRRLPNLQLVAAHVDHGIRPDAQADAMLVKQFCASYNIRYVAKKLGLGSGASEAQARAARYSFLQSCRVKFTAKAIITAHHQDDEIETALINLLRGTGWRGVAPFGSTQILRPLLGYTKKQLQDYAVVHDVPWREDSTNTNQEYLRNFVRHKLVATLSKRNKAWRATFLRHIRKQQQLRRTIEAELQALLQKNAVLNGTSATVQRYFIIMLPHQIGYEFIQALFRLHTGNSLVRDLAQKSLHFAKAARPGKILLINNQWQLHATKDSLIVEPRLSVVS